MSPLEIMFLIFLILNLITILLIDARLRTISAVMIEKLNIAKAKRKSEVLNDLAKMSNIVYGLIRSIKNKR